MATQRHIFTHLCAPELEDPAVCGLAAGAGRGMIDVAGFAPIWVAPDVFLTTKKPPKSYILGGLFGIN